MSVAAMTWAFQLDLKPSSLKFLLVALSDNADDEGRAFPSVDCLVSKTGQDRKTVISGLDKLEKMTLISDTGSRVGRTRQVKIYRIDRFSRVDNSPKSGTVQAKNNTEIGTVQEAERVPFLDGKGTVFPSKGTVFPSKGSRKRDTEPSWNHQKEPSREPKRREAETVRLEDQLETERMIQLAKLKAVYPAGLYPQADWLEAEREIARSLEQGEALEELIAGCERYAAQCTGKGGDPQFVKSPKRFFARADRFWADPWPVPRSKAERKQDANIDASHAWLAQQEAKDASR